MKKKLFILISACMLMMLALGVLEFNGYIWHNELFATGYAVRGLEVSHYQQDINQ